MSTSSPSGLVLTGTTDELRSYRALKVLAAAVHASAPLKRTVLSTCEEVQAQTTPLAKSLALSLPDGNTHIAGSTSSMLRAIASLYPSSGLAGGGMEHQALVDSWMQYGWNAIEIPVSALKHAKAVSSDHIKIQTVTTDLIHALTVLDRHLYGQTYMVGQSVTNADISLVCALYEAATDKLWNPTAVEGEELSSLQNVKRWYDTITHQDFFQTAVSLLQSPTAAVANKNEGPISGVALLNGHDPPVRGRLYKRNRIRIKEILSSNGQAHVNQTVTVAGWTRTTRNANKGQLLFIELNDGSTGQSLQCVLEQGLTSGFDECKNSGGTGSSFQFVGDVVESPASGQAVELRVTRGALLGAVYGGDPEGTQVGGMLYHMSKKAHTLEHMRENAHLRPRGRLHGAAMRVRHAMAYATHKFFHDHGFLYIHTPIVTCVDCEGAGEQFAVTTLLGSDHLKPDLKLPYHEPPPPTPVEDGNKKISKKEQKRLEKKKAAAKKGADPNKPEEEKVIGAVDYSKDFFARRANLTVSGQLNVETHACALSDVYTFGPTFRAENSHTARHLSEFWMIEPEIAFADLTDDINLAEDYLKYLVEYALEMCADDLEFFENNPLGEKGLRERLRNVITNPFKRITYTEAIEILQKAENEDGVKFEEKPVWGIDLPTEHERYICEKVFKQPVVLTDYPKEIKAFYMKLNDDGKTVAAADILVPKIGEIIGGSQREHHRDVLLKRCIETGLDPKAVWWYLDLRKYGTVPHAGFGLGFERLIMFITGLDNIRDVIPFPRWAGNAEF